MTTAATTEPDLDIDLGLSGYEATPNKTARYTVPDLPGPIVLETLAISRRLNPALAAALQRSPRQRRAKSNDPDDIRQADLDDRKENRDLAVKFLVRGWSGIVNRKTGEPVPYSPAAARVVVAQLPADHFDRYFSWCLDESNFAPVMSAADVEEHAGK